MSIHPFSGLQNHCLVANHKGCGHLFECMQSVGCRRKQWVRRRPAKVLQLLGNKSAGRIGASSLSSLAFLVEVTLPARKVAFSNIGACMTTKNSHTASFAVRRCSPLQARYFLVNKPNWLKIRSFQAWRKTGSYRCRTRQGGKG